MSNELRITRVNRLCYQLLVRRIPGNGGSTINRL
jgi:hypothetical protein